VFGLQVLENVSRMIEGRRFNEGLAGIPVSTLPAKLNAPLLFLTPSHFIGQLLWRGALVLRDVRPKL
jgi:hypothetical protein